MEKKYEWCHVQFFFYCLNWTLMTLCFVSHNLFEHFFIAVWDNHFLSCQFLATELFTFRLTSFSNLSNRLIEELLSDRNLVVDFTWGSSNKIKFSTRSKLNMTCAIMKNTHQKRTKERFIIYQINNDSEGPSAFKSTSRNFVLQNKKITEWSNQFCVLFIPLTKKINLCCCSNSVAAIDLLFRLSIGNEQHRWSKLILCK